MGHREMSRQLAFMPLHAASEALERGDVSSTELTQTMLDRISTLDSRLGSFISLYAQGALETARQADVEIRRGERRGPLHGIPLAVKDLFGWQRTTAGGPVRIYRGRSPCRFPARHPSLR